MAATPAVEPRGGLMREFAIRLVREERGASTAEYAVTTIVPRDLVSRSSASRWTPEERPDGKKPRQRRCRGPTQGESPTKEKETTT